MVNYVLMITANLENLTNLQPRGGCDDPTFHFAFKLKCERCGEKSPKESWLSLNETVPLPVGKGVAHLVQKCKFCGRDGMISIVPGKGKPLTLEDSESENYSPLMQFDCRGFEPVDFVISDTWIAESTSGTKFEISDLSSGEFVDYDEKGECPVMVSNLETKFVVAR